MQEVFVSTGGRLQVEQRHRLRRATATRAGLVVGRGVDVAPEGATTAPQDSPASFLSGGVGCFRPEPAAISSAAEAAAAATPYSDSSALQERTSATAETSISAASAATPAKFGDAEAADASGF